MSTILITGTSSGLGLAASVELAQRGERVYASMRDLSRSGPLEEACAAAGVEVRTIQLDITDDASVQRAVGEILTEAGQIDVVLNNAAIAIQTPVEFASDDQLARIFETNVFGALRVARAVLPSMRARGSGRIVNLTSGAANSYMGMRLWGLYAASKSALDTFTLELCKEVAPLGIEVVLLFAHGDSRMTQSARALAKRWDPEGSPYEIAERIFQIQWLREPSAETAEDGAKVMADACLMPDPPLRYPPDQANFGSAVLDDESFLRLARLEDAPELDSEAAMRWPRLADVERQRTESAGK